MSKRTTTAHSVSATATGLTYQATHRGTEYRTKYEYDALGQVKSGKKFWADGTPVAGQQFEYAFDDIGNRTSTKTGGDASGGDLRSSSYSPDLLNQYTQRTNPPAIDISGAAHAQATVQVNSQAAYRKGEYYQKKASVDNANAVFQSVTVSSARSGYSSTNYTGNVFVPKATENFVYDADGNLTSDSHWNYYWDGENRLISMEEKLTHPVHGQRKLDFEYDWMGRRIGKKLSHKVGNDWILDSETRFLYDGWNLVAELSGNNTLIAAYMWGLDLSGSRQGAGGVGGLLAMFPGTANSAAQFAVYDGNGNVMALVDGASGSVSANYEYGPFGELIRETGPMSPLNHLRFSTKVTDEESDLLYYGFRYYSASSGRWLSRDPVEESGGLNIYSFLNNDPEDFYDTFGLLSGHHKIPRAVIKAICPKSGEKLFNEFFDIAAAVIPVPDKTHDFSAHGEYSRRVEALLRDFMKAHKIKCNCLNKKVAKKIIKMVDGAKDPYIRGFLRVVGKGDKAVAAWFEAEGALILNEEALAMEKASGIAGKVRGKVRYAKYGGKVVKVMLIGTFVYMVGEDGLKAATEQTFKDLVFADEILAGGDWLFDTTTQFFERLDPESCCERNGLDFDELYGHSSVPLLDH